MKPRLAFFALFAILLYVSCEKTGIDKRNSIQFELDNKPKVIKKVTVANNELFRELFPNTKQYLVFGEYYPEKSNSRAEMRFYFIEKGGELDLYYVTMNSLAEDIGFGIDASEDRFKKQVAYSITREGTKVTCKFKIDFLRINLSKTPAYLTNGICQFDLASIR